MQVGGSGGGGAGEDLNSEINVTPFVDVMLVLLIIFMVTAPLLTTGVEMDLPDTDAPMIEDEKGKLILSIGKDHDLLLGKAPVKWVELEEKLLANARVQKEKTLWIGAHQDLPYRYVVTAMARARAAGVSKLMLLTDRNAEMDLSKLDQGVPVPATPAPEEPVE
jgi:biopolymer transport protein TolR